jgi:hypothetical protein
VSVGSLDELAGLEAGSGPYESDEVGCVDRAPAGLGGLDEYECHGQPGGSGAGAAGDFGPVPDGAESGFDGYLKLYL